MQVNCMLTAKKIYISEENTNNLIDFTMHNNVVKDSEPTAKCMEVQFWGELKMHYYAHYRKC